MLLKRSSNVSRGNKRPKPLLSFPNYLTLLLSYPFACISAIVSQQQYNSVSDNSSPLQLLACNNSLCCCVFALYSNSLSCGFRHFFGSIRRFFRFLLATLAASSGFFISALGTRSFSTPLSLFFSSTMRLPLTLNIQCGKKLSGKTKEDILKEVLKVFDHYHIKCVQIVYEVIRVTLASVDEYKVAKQQPGIRLFGWCPIYGGSRPYLSFISLTTLMKRRMCT